MHDSYIVIGTWESGESQAITLQDFVLNGESFIPIFSDEDTFKVETKGSEFATSGVAIDRQFLLSLLRGDELLILNPGSENPMRLRAEDLQESNENLPIPDKAR
jgi:SseB protein N-terminal domain